MAINTWAAAIEDGTSGSMIGDAPTAEFNIDVNPVDETGTPLEAVDAAGEPTLDVVNQEVDEAGDEVEEAEEVVENLEETQEVLEAFQSIIESRIAHNNGLTQGEYEIMQVSLRRLNMGKKRVDVTSLFPSSEAFGYSRLSASNEAMQEIKDGLAKIWKAIKDAIMAVVNKVKEWWIKVFDQSSRMGKRADGIVKEAKKRDTAIDSDKDSTISVGVTNKLIDRTGKVPTDNATFVAWSDYLNTVTDTMLKTLPKKTKPRIDRLKNDLEKILNHSGAGAQGNLVGDITEDGVYDNLKGFSESGGDFEKAANPDIDNRFNIKYRITKDLPGNMVGVFTIATPKVGVEFNASTKNDQAKKEKFAVLKANGKLADVDKEQDFNALSIDSIIKIAENVATICDMVKNYELDFRNRNKLVDDIKNQIDRYVNKVENKHKSDESTTVLETKKAFMNYVATTMKREATQGQEWVKYCMTTCNALLTYCARSLTLYPKS